MVRLRNFLLLALVLVAFCAVSSQAQLRAKAEPEKTQRKLAKGHFSLKQKLHFLRLTTGISAIRDALTAINSLRKQIKKQLQELCAKLKKMPEKLKKCFGKITSKNSNQKRALQALQGTMDGFDPAFKAAVSDTWSGMTLIDEAHTEMLQLLSRIEATITKNEDPDQATVNLLLSLVDGVNSALDKSAGGVATTKAALVDVVRKPALPEQTPEEAANQAAEAKVVQDAVTLYLGNVEMLDTQIRQSMTELKLLLTVPPETIAAEIPAVPTGRKLAENGEVSPRLVALLELAAMGSDAVSQATSALVMANAAINGAELEGLGSVDLEALADSSVLPNLYNTLESAKAMKAFVEEARAMDDASMLIAEAVINELGNREVVDEEVINEAVQVLQENAAGSFTSLLAIREGNTPNSANPEEVRKQLNAALEKQADIMDVTRAHQEQQ